MKKKVVTTSRDAELLRKLRDRSLVNEAREQAKKEAWVRKLERMASPQGKEVPQEALERLMHPSKEFFEAVADKILKEGL